MRHHQSRAEVRRSFVQAASRAIGSELLESRQMLCGLPHSHVIAPPKWSAAIEASESQAERNGSGDAGTANIVWANRGLASDRFAVTFGTSANAARNVVDNVIAYWEDVITDWNRADGTTTLQVNISMDTGGGNGASGGPDSTAPADGKPRTGGITIGQGNLSADPNDFNGFHIDDNPRDNSEYQGTIINAFAGGNSAGVGADFFSLVSAEMAHVLGLISDPNNGGAGAGWQGYRLENFVTNTGIRDNAEGGGSFGFFYTFDGPTIDHLMTGYNSGNPTSASWGNAVHTAGANGNINFDGKNWRGSEDSGNASYGSERTLPSYAMANIFKDAYGYSIVQPDTFGTMYAILDSTTGNVLVRGGDFHAGSPVSNDKFYITQDGTDLLISVDVPTDVPGTYALSGAGDYPSWTTRIPISSINTITINAEDGDDDIYVYDIPSGVNVVVNAGTGADYIQIGNGDVDNTCLGGVTVNAGTGTDSMEYYDLLDTAGDDAYTLTATTLTKPFSTVVVFGSDLEQISVIGSGQNNNFDVNGSNFATDFLLYGFGGNDTFTIDVDFDSALFGVVSCIGGAGTDNVLVDDSADSLADSYTVSGNRFEKSSSDAAVYIHSSTESLDATLNDASNDVLVPQLSPWMNVTLHGGAGAETFTVANNNFDVNLLGSVSIDGGTGADSLFASDSADTGNDPYNYYFNRIDKGAAGYIGFTAIESCLLNANSGSNTIKLFSSTTSIPTTINGNNGDDSFFVNDGTGFLFNFGGDVTLNGGTGDDSVTMDDSGFGGTGTYTATNGHIVAPFNGFDVFHSSMSFLQITGSTGNNTINIDQTNILTFAFGDDGDDTINVGGDNFEANITEDVLVLGGDGNDFAYYRDALDTGNDTYTINTGGVAKPTSTASLLTNFLGPLIDNIVVIGNVGNNTFNIESNGTSSIPVNVLVSAGLGNDTMNAVPTTQDISSLYGNVTLNGEGGTDSIIINDLLGAGADTTVLGLGMTKSDWGYNLNYFATSTNENITLNASNAASTIQMIGSPGTAAFRINANGGADDIDIEGNSLGTAITVTSGAGLDTLRVNDDASGVARVDLIQSEDLDLLFTAAGGLVNVLPGGNKVLDINGATLSGRLDLNDNYFIRRNNANLAFYDTRLRAGYNGGAWTTTSDASIFSTVASTATSAKDALGMAAAGIVGVTTFGGVAVAAGDLLIGYTQYGDTDLDRDVDFDDLLRLAQNYGLAGKYWYQGTFNYDAGGSVTFDDLLSLTQNYGTTLVRATGSMTRSVLSSRENDSILV